MSEHIIDAYLRLLKAEYTQLSQEQQREHVLGKIRQFTQDLERTTR